MRLLITGVSGLLGFNLAWEAQRSHPVVGVHRGRLREAPFPLIEADLLTPGLLPHILDQTRPEAVIHCAALADLEACEADPHLARRTNVDLPAQLADACARRKIRLVHVSTDAVFDGEKDGCYTEWDAPRPLSVYARTKYEAEQAVLRLNPNAVVARVNFYGWSLSGRRSLAEFFVYNLMHGRSVHGFTDVIFCPMWVNHLGQILLKMLERGLRGLYHVVGPQAMSKYQFGVEVARAFGLDESLISPQSVRGSGLTARRSSNLWLSTHRLSTDLGLSLPPFSTGLAEFYAQYRQGYPQKIRSYAQVGLK